MIVNQTIFSISSLFGTDNGHLVISSEFYIFWSIAIPLTVVVLVIYTLWAQRAEIRAWLSERSRKRYLKRQKRLGSDEKPMERDLEKGERSDAGVKETVLTQEDRKQV